MAFLLSGIGAFASIAHHGRVSRAAWTMRLTFFLALQSYQQPLSALIASSSPLLSRPMAMPFLARTQIQRCALAAL
jgi:hypothetical protein